jgi:hypothetical protein
VKRHEGFGPEVQRYLDGEGAAEVSADERARADRLAEAARGYGESLPSLDARLDDAVMAAVRARTPGAAPAGWRWLLAPQSVRIRPVFVPLVAAAALALWFLPRGVRQDATPAPEVVAAAAPAAHDTVFVRFDLAAPGARAVAVAGSFNGWRPESMRMARSAGGVWSVTVPLAIGEHHYQFVVDGQRWVPDPTAQALVDDGFGGRNSVIVVGPKGVVRS